MGSRDLKRKKSLNIKKNRRENNKNNNNPTPIFKYNYLLTLTYDGSTYGGYAKQKFSNTIQEQLENALFHVFQEHIKTIEASRTDSKVHALNQKVMFKFKEIKNFKKLLIELNNILPTNIEILQLEKVPQNFHVRYDVISKTYLFKIHTKKSIFLNNYSFYWEIKNIDLEYINKMCNLFVGEHDFIGFSSAKRDSVSTVRTIYYFNFQKIDENTYFFKINGNGFLYNMIRIIIGTIIENYQLNSSLQKVEEILLSKNRNLAGQTIAANGLYLAEINYK